MSTIIELKEKKSDPYGRWAGALAGRTSDRLDAASSPSLSPERQLEIQREIVQARRAWANYLPFWDDTSASKYSTAEGSKGQPEDCQYSI
jgi:hypothetical protein